MVKRIVWTNTAKKARRDILEYWIKHNGSNTYSKNLSRLFRIKVALLQSGHYLGKPTDFKDVRVSLVSHFSIFYKVGEGAVSQKAAPNAPDTIVSNLLDKLTDHDEIARDIAIKYLHLDSIELQENPSIRSDSSFSFGSHIFWIVSYAALINCENKELIEYKKESRVFAKRS
jgi:toxin YoeB